MTTALITGVGGFIGSHVARRFLREGYQVVGVDDLSGGSRDNVPDGVEFVHGDLAQAATMARLPRGCRTILHLAGQSSGEISFDDPVADLRKNTVSTLNLIRYGIENQVERCVYASSMSLCDILHIRSLSYDSGARNCKSVPKTVGIEQEAL